MKKYKNTIAFCPIKTDNRREMYDMFKYVNDCKITSIINKKHIGIEERNFYGHPLNTYSVIEKTKESLLVL